MYIKEALITDVLIVKQIVEITILEIYPHYYPKGAVEFFIEHHNEARIAEDIHLHRVYLCCDDQQNIVGTITIKNNEICRWFVLPNYQGNGYGIKMLTYAEEKIASQYSESILDSSLPAKKLYQKRGYKDIEFHCIATKYEDFLCYDTMKKEV